MPRISLWQDGKHSNDYQYIDARIREMYTLGGLGINIYKYLGPAPSVGSTDATKPDYLNPTEQNIQDLLFVENRDRKYDQDVHVLRGVYQTTDIDFDLSQFGMFLANDTLFITFHLNDMVEMLGRKIMAGDVFELPHLKDYYSLDDSVPYALKRFYVVQDATRASEGFSPTWWPHLWRVKCVPLVDSQEYQDIINSIKAGDNTNDTLADILSQYDKSLQLNDAVLEQAEAEVPKSGYDTSHLYVVPTRSEDGGPADPETIIGADGSTQVATETSPSGEIRGWLTGDGLAPNGFPVTPGISFPMNPTIGDFVLRTDYYPQRLFRFDGYRWVKMEDLVRTNYTPGSSETLKGGFINNDANVALDSSTTVVSKEGLSEVVKNRTRD